MGRKTKHFKHHAANRQNTARQRLNTRKRHSDDKEIEKLESAFAYKLKVRHHARKGVLRIGDEAASFGASKIDRMSGITPGHCQDGLTGEWDYITLTRYKDVEDDQWYINIKASMISVKVLLMAHDVNAVDIIHLPKMGGYVVTQETFDALCIKHPEFKDLT